MPFTRIVTDIDAPIEVVFDTVSDIQNFSKAIPHITNVEFLTEQKTGIGTRFVETRLMNGRETSTELEVTEFEQNKNLRIVTDSHGTVWDTIFTTEEVEGSTRLTLMMDARPHALLARIMIPLTKGVIKKAIAGDMEAVKAYCEAENS